MEYKDIETYEKKIARTFFNLAEDIANKELKKLKLENEKLREQLRLHGVSNERKTLLDFAGWLYGNLDKEVEQQIVDDYLNNK